MALGRGQRTGHTTWLRQRRHSRRAGRHAHGRTRPTIGWYRRHRLRIGLPHLIPEGPRPDALRLAERCRYSPAILPQSSSQYVVTVVIGVNDRATGPGPPALHGVKSTARLATTSGGFAIVEVRPAGEPARTSCSAQGLPSPELDPASPPVGIAVHRTTQRRRSQGTKPRA